MENDKIPNSGLLHRIGVNSTISEHDFLWLKKLGNFLHDEGHYTKNIYLTRLLKNSARVPDTMGDDMGIITPDEATHLADQRFSGDEAWNSYFDSNYPALLAWLNKKLINMKETNISSFNVKLDYPTLFGIFSEHPPSDNAGGMEKFFTKLDTDLSESGWCMVTNYYDNISGEFMIMEALEEVEQLKKPKCSWSFWPDAWK